MTVNANVVAVNNSPVTVIATGTSANTAFLAADTAAKEWYGVSKRQLERKLVQHRAETLKYGGYVVTVVCIYRKETGDAEQESTSLSCSS